ncbi:MAG: DNA-binding protein WhiA [Candidatus Onthoplasma sp.]
MKDCKTQILNSMAKKNCSLIFLHSVLTANAEITKHNILITADEQILTQIETIILNDYLFLDISRWNNCLSIGGDIEKFLKEIDFSSDSLKNFHSQEEKIIILQSIYLVCGRFYYNQDSTKNSKGYRFEIVLKKQNLANLVVSLFSEFNFNLNIAKRANQIVVYSRNSSQICDLFVFLGAQYTALEIQNNLAMREMRNVANRQNNCFESNLDKTINASSLQIDAINYIISNLTLDSLDENLKEVALARLANPDVSLGDLQKVLNNKLSRAGIKYRLDKIIEIYKKHKGEEK